MAAASGGAKGGYTRRNSRRRKSAGVMHEINVTPLVDVMLVLLIVFMVAAPLMTVGIDIELPKMNAQALGTPTEPITISLRDDRKVYLQNTEVPLDQITAKLLAISKNGYEEKILFRADANVPYGAVTEVFSFVRSAGFSKIILNGDYSDELPTAGSSN